MKFFEYKFDKYTSESLKSTLIKQSIKWAFMLAGFVIGVIILYTDDNMILASVIGGWWVLPTVIKYAFFATVGALVSSSEYYEVDYSSGRISKKRDFTGSLFLIILVIIISFAVMMISLLITPLLLINRLIQLILISVVLKKRNIN